MSYTPAATYIAFTAVLGIIAQIACTGPNVALWPGALWGAASGLLIILNLYAWKEGVKEIRRINRGRKIYLKK